MLVQLLARAVVRAVTHLEHCLPHLPDRFHFLLTHRLVRIQPHKVINSLQIFGGFLRGGLLPQLLLACLSAGRNALARHAPAG